MAKLVNVAVSEAVGNCPLRVRVSLRAHKKKRVLFRTRFFFVHFTTEGQLFESSTIRSPRGLVTPVYTEAPPAYPNPSITCRKPAMMAGCRSCRCACIPITYTGCWQSPISEFVYGDKSWPRKQIESGAIATGPGRSVL